MTPAELRAQAVKAIDDAQWGTKFIGVDCSMAACVTVDAATVLALLDAAVSGGLLAGMIYNDTGATQAQHNMAGEIIAALAKLGE